jgi:hypothetical protein
MVFDHQAEHPLQWAAINSIAGKIGCTGETLRNWVRGRRPRKTARGSKRSNPRPRAAPGQRDPAQSICAFCSGGARPPVQAMIALIADHRAAFGVEPVCRALPICPSTYHAQAARRADPASLPARNRRDLLLIADIRRVFDANFCVYGMRKMWLLRLRFRDCFRRELDVRRSSARRFKAQQEWAPRRAAGARDRRSAGEMEHISARRRFQPD